MCKSQSIYDDQLNDQLKEYTLNLLLYLEKQQLLSVHVADIPSSLFDGMSSIGTTRKCCATVRLGKVQKVCNKPAIQNGKLCSQHLTKNKASIELEYIELHGKQYYLCTEDNSVYSYQSNPKRLGIYDFATEAIVVV